MSKENLNATCSICGKKYHMCVTCSEVKSFMPWRTIVDTVNCYKIFLILRDYTNKAKTKESAKADLEKCDLSGISIFIPEVKSTIEEILKEETKIKKIKTLSMEEKDNVSESE